MYGSEYSSDVVLFSQSTCIATTPVHKSSPSDGTVPGGSTGGLRTESEAQDFDDLELAVAHLVLRR